jgi:hypothetical protein
MNQVQASYQIPVLLKASEEWRYYWKCFQLNIAEENLKNTGRNTQTSR